MLSRVFSCAVADSPRVSISVSIVPAARSILDRLREDTGVPQTEAMARLLEWFAAQPRKFRLALLNRDVETQRELIRAVLLEWAGIDAAQKIKDAGPASIPEALAVARAMLDEVEARYAADQRFLKKRS
jgi:hypothetical protein